MGQFVEFFAKNLGLAMNIGDDGAKKHGVSGRRHRIVLINDRIYTLFQILKHNHILRNSPEIRILIFSFIKILKNGTAYF